MTLSDLVEALAGAKNAALVVGAGISHDMKIPLGYEIPMLYGEEHPHLLKKYGIDAAWQQAKEAADDDKWRLEERFVQSLVDVFMHSLELQQTFVDWLSKFKTMSGASSDIHAAFVIAWLNRVFKHLVTTNWDFLLEYHAEAIYEESYLMPFEPVSYTFDGGQVATIPAERLFFLDQLDGDDFFWHPRWDIVTSRSDLKNLQRWTRPIWKIHGSPFFLACPKCGGFSRWKRVEKLTVGDRCPEHPDEVLKPEIVFWGQGIDTADAMVWGRLKGRLKRSDMIVACGFSGSGSDVYLRSVIEEHSNAWLVNPDSGAWDTDRVRHVPVVASELAGILIDEFLI